MERCRADFSRIGEFIVSVGASLDRAFTRQGGAGTIVSQA
jgi:hypothetical protein